MLLASFELSLSIQYSYTIFSIVMNPPLYEAETMENKWVKLTICCDICNFPDTIYSIFKKTNRLILTIYYKSPILHLTSVWEINTQQYWLYKLYLYLNIISDFNLLTSKKRVQCDVKNLSFLLFLDSFLFN